jgi:hypothetical protein
VISAATLNSQFPDSSTLILVGRNLKIHRRITGGDGFAKAFPFRLTGESMSSFLEKNSLTKYRWLGRIDFRPLAGIKAIRATLIELLSNLYLGWQHYD